LRALVGRALVLSEVERGERVVVEGGELPHRAAFRRDGYERRRLGERLADADQRGAVARQREIADRAVLREGLRLAAIEMKAVDAVQAGIVDVTQQAARIALPQRV